MHRDFTRQLFACAAAALLASACSRDPKPGTPEATAAGERVMRSMSDSLARSKTFAFETSEVLDLVGPGEAKRTLRFTRKVTVRRPSALFFELHGTGDTALDITVRYDGHTLTASSGPDKVWAETDVPGTLDETMDDVARRFGLPVPIADVVYSSPYDAFIGRTTKGGFVARETLDSVPCVKLDYDDAFVGVRLWIPASGEPLPRRLELVYKQAPGSMARIDFTRWSLDVPTTDAMFAFQPTEGHPQLEFLSFVEGLSSGKMPSGQGAAVAATPAPAAAAKPKAR